MHASSAILDQILAYLIKLDSYFIMCDSELSRGVRQNKVITPTITASLACTEQVNICTCPLGNKISGPQYFTDAKSNFCQIYKSVFT